MIQARITQFSDKAKSWKVVKLGFDSQQGNGFFSSSYHPDQLWVQPNSRLVNRMGLEADLSSYISAAAKNKDSYISIHLDVFIALYLIKY
jgi:hypothetical protein